MTLHSRASRLSQSARGYSVLARRALFFQPDGFSLGRAWPKCCSTMALQRLAPVFLPAKYAAEMQVDLSAPIDGKSPVK